MYFANGKKDLLKGRNVQEATENGFTFGVKNLLLDTPTRCSPIQKFHVIFTLWNIPVSHAVSHFEAGTHRRGTAGQVQGR